MRIRYLPPLIYLVLSVFQLLLVVLPWGQKYVYIWNDTSPIYSLFWNIINYFSYSLLTTHLRPFFPSGITNVPIVILLLIFGIVSLIIYYLIGVVLEITIDRIRLLSNRTYSYKPKVKL